MDDSRSQEMQLEHDEKAHLMPHCGQFYKNAVHLPEGFLYQSQMQQSRFNVGQSLPPSSDKAIHKDQEYTRADQENSFQIGH